MITILTADENVSAIMGNQPFSRDDEYRLSFLCVTVTVQEGTLLFNNLTKELVLIDTSIKDISSNDYTLLVRKWFFVSSKTDEIELVTNVRSLLHLTYEKVRSKNITILPTTDCNARCFYCFEKNMVRKNMTETTALQTVSFIKRQLKPGEHLTIRWFGGEPLTNIGPIDLICNELKQKEKILFSSSLITNGFLLDAPLLQHAIDMWNLKNIQITLDGSESIYNKTKAFIYPDSNPFQTVIKNIVNISTTSVFLVIRLNIDTYNISDMFHLIEILSHEIQNKKNIRFSLSPLFEYAGATPHIRTEETRKNLFESIEQLHTEIVRSGFTSNGLPTALKATYCGADSRNAIVVLPNGDLIRCEHIVELNPVGSVFSTTSSFADGVWTEYEPDKDLCHSCALYPECNRPIGCKEGTLCSPAIKEWKRTKLIRKMNIEYNKYRS